MQHTNLRTKIMGARSATSTWVLWLGMIAGTIGSLVVILNWISGAALHNGIGGFIEALLSTIVILWFTIDSEIRLCRRLLRR